MFVISVSGRESESIYYAIDENKEEVIYFFEEVDDAWMCSLFQKIISPLLCLNI